MSKEKVMDKIRKLLALSQSPNENEASNAMSKVQELLLEHELDISQVEGVKTSDIMEDNFTENRPGIAKWEQRLMSGIANSLNCRIIISSGWHGWTTKRYTWHMVGFSADTEVCKYLYSYLMDAIKSLVKGEMKGLSFDTGREREVHRESFLYGVVMTINSKVSEKFKEVIQQSEEIHALIRRKDAEVSRYVDDNYNLGKNRSRTGMLDYDAVIRGKIAGEGISISKGMNSAGAQRQKQITG